ncbi:MAG: ribonuclease III [Firmicutes bacterium HGW-Firmicutes-14]|nr:MAG: ribonuclease III [Firmicutes bacterium HGW-Firmicutes-14]
MDGIDLQKLQTVLGIEWKEPKHLLQAVTHSSFAHENKALNLENNQRLEFLGDAVLELAVSDYLYRRFADYPEGTLTKIRAGIVCEPSLAHVAGSMDLGEYLLMGKGEERSGGRERPSILADAMEAIIGAVYIDQGMEKSFSFIIEKLEDIIEKVISNGGLHTDYKTHLQELVQKKSDNPLNYRIIEEYGPDHSKTFVAGVDYQGELWGSGTGRTKKEAEQAAAKDALGKINGGILKFQAGDENE